MHDDSHRFDEVVDAAIEAEFETGRREETIEEAQAHVVIRVARMSLGFAVLLVGVLMLVLPGPGLLAIGGGLMILARDVAWADRLYQRIVHRLPQDADGKVPQSVVVTMIVMAMGAAALTTWWFYVR